MTAVAVPWQLGVREAADAIASRSLTPTELLDALLARIEALEPRLQAWTYYDAESARKEAAVLTAEAAAGKLRGPLHGIPFGVKDIFHIKGMPKGAEDSAAVERLRAAGAIPLGKLQMPGPKGRPPTRNPWDLERTPGGSSSGSGAAAGGCMVPFTLGEQTAGSGLRPAAYCGAGALKPSFGRISRYGMMLNAWSLDHVVIMARSVEDLARVYSVLAGPDHRDPSTDVGQPPSVARAGEGARSTPRIGILRDYYLETSGPAMQQAVARAAERFKQAGATIRDIPLPKEFDVTWSAHGVIFAAEREAVRAHLPRPAAFEGLRQRRPDTPRRERDGRVKAVMLPPDLGPFIPAGYYLQAKKLQRWFRERLLGLFADCDIVLTPTADGPAPLFDKGSGDNSFLIPWSLVGYPAASVPCGLSPEGMPLGLQLVGRPLDDEGVLSAAAWVEGVLGRLPLPPN